MEAGAIGGDRTFAEMPVIGGFARVLGVITDPKNQAKILKGVDKIANAICEVGSQISSATEVVDKLSETMEPFLDKTVSFVGLVGCLKFPWDIVALFAVADKGEMKIVEMWHKSRPELANRLSLTAQHGINAVQFIAGKIAVLTPVLAGVNIVVSITGIIAASFKIHEGVNEKRLHRERIDVWTHRLGKDGEDGWSDAGIIRHYESRCAVSHLQAYVAGAKMHARMGEYHRILQSDSYRGTEKELFNEINEHAFAPEQVKDAKIVLKAIDCLSKTHKETCPGPDEPNFVHILLNGSLDDLKEICADFNDSSKGFYLPMKKRQEIAEEIYNAIEILKTRANDAPAVEISREVEGGNERFAAWHKKVHSKISTVNNDLDFKNSCKELGRDPKWVSKGYERANGKYQHRLDQLNRRRDIATGKEGALEKIKECFAKKAEFYTKVSSNWDEFNHRTIAIGSLNLAFSSVMGVAGVATVIALIVPPLFPVLGLVVLPSLLTGLSVTIAVALAVGALLEVARTLYPALHQVEKEKKYHSCKDFKLPPVA